MSTKEKPRLHLVAGNGDPELFNTDLDWFFGCFDAECGLKSSQGGDMGGYQINTANGGGMEAKTRNSDNDGEEVTVKAKKPVIARQENLPYTDRHASFKSNERLNHEQCVFTRGRRVWQRLSRIPWALQEVLRTLYEPRRERPHIPEQRVREAHRAYREATVAA
jgi:hypothetical protein